MRLSVELRQGRTGTRMLLVPCEAIPMAIADVVSGRLRPVSDNLAAIPPHGKANRSHPPGMTTLKRSPVLPDLPRRAPRDIVLRRNAEINRTLQTAPIAARLASLGGDIIGDTPELFSERVRRERSAWAGALKAAGFARG